MNRAFQFTNQLANILFAIAISLFSVLVHAQELSDFGHQSMRTNGKAAVGNRPLVTVLINSRDENAPRYGSNAASQYRARFFNASPTSVGTYFRQHSGGKFNFTNRGFFGPYNARGGRCFSNDNKATRKLLREEAVRALLADTNFDAKQFDQNRDKILTPDELAILVLYSCGNKKGASPTSGEVRAVDVSANGFRFKGSLASGKQTIGTPTLLHELSHLLGTYDLYNADDDCACAGLSLLNTSHRVTAGLDAPHKLALGWIAPSVIDVSGVASMKPVWLAADDANGTTINNKAVLIYDSSKNNREFFLLERRSNNGFDAQNQQTGFALWRISLKRTGNKLDKIQLMRPDYHRLGLTPGLTTVKALFDADDGAFSPFYSDRSYLNAKLKIQAGNRRVVIESGKSFTAAVVPTDKFGYFFQPTLYKRFNFELDKVDRTRITGIDHNNFDAQFNYADAALLHPSNGKVYFFKGKHYYRYNLEHQRIDKIELIGGCATCWTGVPIEPDAALTHPNGKAYFFKDRKYYRYDFASGKVDKEGIIGGDGWSGLPPFLDAAIIHPNGNAYFFQGGRYHRYSFRKDKVDRTAQIGQQGWIGLSD